MRSRAGLALCLLMAWSFTTAAAPAAPPSKARAVKVTPATTAKVARIGAAKGPAASPRPAARPKSGEATRTLQDIHIEGEIPVPQVLFITARDQRRFLDFQHRRYLRTSQQVGEQTVLPSWIGVTGNHPTEARKENPQ